MERKIVAIGGGKIPKWSFETKTDEEVKYETKEIDEEIIRLSGKTNPKVLFIGTASRENDIYFNAIKDIYESYGAIVKKMPKLEFNEMHETKEEFINKIRLIVLASSPSPIVYDLSADSYSCISDAFITHERYDVLELSKSLPTKSGAKFGFVSAPSVSASYKPSPLIS